MGQCSSSGSASSSKGAKLPPQARVNGIDYTPGGSFKPGSDSDLPSFQLLGRVMDDALVNKVRNINLGEDESMKVKTNTAKRDKAIRFLFLSRDRVVPLAQSYFQQEAGYNDFSGGYKRFYNSIDDETVTRLQPVVKKFLDYYRLPDKTIILMQIQTSTFKTKAVRNSVTGQGIHTDGANRAMIVCLERGEGVKGAENQFHGTLDASKPLCKPTVLNPGDAAVWKDNEIYHYVCPGVGTPDKDNKRTMLLMHAPAEMFLWGVENPHNTLGATVSEIKLRKDEPQALKEIVQDVAELELKMDPLEFTASV